MWLIIVQLYYEIVVDFDFSDDSNEINTFMCKSVYSDMRSVGGEVSSLFISRALK